MIYHSFCFLLRTYGPDVQGLQERCSGHKRKPFRCLISEFVFDLLVQIKQSLTHTVSKCGVLGWGGGGGGGVVGGEGSGGIQKNVIIEKGHV